MYYKTILQKVGTTGAIDSDGKKLSFMSYIEVQAGDTVWTDGKFIFGHALEIEDTPFVPIMNSGIPVLGYGDFRGYIKPTTGTYKESKIVRDDWIVNDDKKFFHGKEKINGQKIIDAEISEDGDLYTVAEGFYIKNQTASYNNFLIHVLYWIVDKELQKLQNSQEREFPYSTLFSINSYQGQKIDIGVDTEDKDDNLIIYKNNSPIVSFNLKFIADMAVEKALETKDEIMAQSSQDGLSLMNTASPPDDFIASAYARIITFKVHKNGDWDAVVSTSAYGYCFPFVSFDISVFCAAFPNGENQHYNRYLKLCVAEFEKRVFEQNRFSLSIEKYHNFEGTEYDESGNVTEEYANYIVDKVNYYIPLAKFKHKIWYPCIYNASFLFKLHNGEIVDTIQSYAGGGFDLELTDAIFEWNEKSFNFSIEKSITIETQETRKEWSFPLDDEYYFVADGTQIKAIYDKEDKKIFDIPQNLDLADDFYEAYAMFPLEPFISKEDETVASLAASLNLETKSILHSNLTDFNPHYKIYSTNNKNENPKETYATIPQVVDQFLWHNGWFDNKKAGQNEFSQMNHIFAELKNGDYLLGIKDKKIYKISEDDGAEELNDKIKNFRLRNLKNILKAKREN